MKRIWGCAALVGWLLAVPAWGANHLFDDHDVPRVLTPARLDQPISEVPASVSVIDRSLIRASGARELYEVLRLVPGMSVAKTDGNVPAVAYHGTQARDQRRMLVLIDGRSVYQPGFARVNWNDLPVSLLDVERIEVTRGPAAAAYGANAFSGVINIITRDPRDSAGQIARVRAGNNGIRDGLVAASHQFDHGAFRISVSSQSDDGYDAGLIDGGDSKHIDKLNSRSVLEIGDRDIVTMFAGGSRSRLDRPPEGGLRRIGQYSQDSEQKNDRAFLALEWRRQFSATHQLKVTTYAQYNNQSTNLDLCYLDPLTGQPGPGAGLYFSRELRELYLANGREIPATLAAAFGDPAVRNRYATLRASGAGNFCGRILQDIREERYDLELQDTLQLSSWARLVAGFNVRSDRGGSRLYLSGGGENFAHRAFANLAVKPGRQVTINLGGFWEKEDIGGEQFSPRAGINWEFLPGQSLRFIYATAVRTPDTYEQRADLNLGIRHLSGDFASHSQALLGWNPAYFFVTQTSPGTLRSETIRSREIGYYGHFGSGLAVDVRYFREELRDLISGAFTPFNFEPNNDGYVNNRGAELQASWRPNSEHFMRLTAAHRRSDTNQGAETRFAARNSGSALWMWTLNNHWFWSTTYYLARDYNSYRFERLDNQIGYRRRIGATEWQWRFLIQHPLADAPIVFEQNRYRDTNRYWLTMTVSF